MQPLQGTVTFLFSDIEGSTRLLQQLGDRYAAGLEQHQRLIRDAIAEHDGDEIATEGDSFFVAFPSASGAVQAAVRAQRSLIGAEWPAGEAFRVRMGLHTGEATRGGDSYVGIDVHRAARIAAAAHGGQVLVSETTRVLVEASLPPGASLRDLGSHRLKDLSAPERLHQLVIDGVPDEFPPLMTLDATPNNLPVQLTSFLGREREIGEVEALLEKHRLVTLTGPGGTGKTRLSLQVAGRAADRYPDGVYFVGLSTLTDAGLVAATIAHALELPDRGGRSDLERVLDHVAQKRLLLVLDNFEQLTAAAPVVSQLLTHAPALGVLATSREALHLYGEQEYPVPPLGVPPLDDQGSHGHPDVQSLSQYESVALFIERAMAVKPDFAVDNENAPAVAEICVRLDGLPLAIELAAARIRILTPQAIMRRLGHQLDLLSGGGSDRPERQQTLRGAIAWSYDLLDERDRRLFACLCVFSGGATLEAIEEVCGHEVDGDVLDCLSSLVDKSLVRQRSADDEPRFTQLQTIREYAAERAAQDGILDDLRTRHAEFFARLASEASAVIMGSDKRRWLDRLEQEHGNLRAAFDFAIERADAALALRLAADLWRFWQMRGYLAEGLIRVRAALALSAPASGDAALRELRSHGLEAAGGLAYWQGNMVAARDYYEQALAAAQSHGSDAAVANALYNLSFVFSVPAAGGGESMLDAERSRELVSQALEIYRRIGDRAGTARVLWALSNSAWTGNEPELGERHAAEALSIFRELGDAFSVAWALYTVGMMRLQMRQLESAAQPLRESLRMFADVEDLSGYALVLDGLAAEAYLLGDLRRSARLVGAVRALQQSSGTGLAVANRELIGFTHEPIISNPELRPFVAEGERLSSADAVAFGLEPATLEPGGLESAALESASAEQIVDS
jgi:predicted ATPase/class 3 adenylate cyclase